MRECTFPIKYYGFAKKSKKSKKRKYWKKIIEKCEKMTFLDKNDTHVVKKSNANSGSKKDKKIIFPYF